MFTAIISGYRFLYLQLAAIVGYGWAIVALSFICSFLMLPLMRAVAGVVRREKEYEDVIDPQVAEIKAKYASDMERHQHIQSLYARYAYSPLAPIKKVLPLFVQIPFLLLTYYMLKGTAELGGVAFLFLSDLGRPDALLAGINALPLVMTGVNILTVFATPGFSHKDWTQAIAISLLFLVLLYTAPSALLLYWTLNNTITFVRTLGEKHFAGATLLVSRIVKLPALIASSVHFQRPSMLRTLAGFGGLSILVLLPVVYLLLSVIPQDLRVEVVTDAPVSVRVDEMRGDGSDGFSVQLSVVRDFSKVQLYREFLPPDVDARKLACTFECSSRDQIVLKGVRLVIADLFAWDLTASDMRECYTMTDGMSVSDGDDGTIVLNLPGGKGTLTPRADVVPHGHWAGICPTGLIIPRSAPKLFLILPVILIVLACFGSIVFARCTDRRRMLKLSVWIALLACVYVMMILPAQSFWANRVDYAFSTFELFGSQLVPVVLTTLVLALGLYLAGQSFGFLPHLLLLAFIVYEYLQTGVLSIGAPTLNGDMSYYSDHTRVMRDVGVLLVCFAAFVVAYRFMANKLGKVVTIIAGVIIISVIPSVRFQVHSEGSQPQVTGYCSKLDVLKNLEFSKRNIIVLVLDSVTTEVVSDIFKKSPEIAEQFAGFIVFENNAGVHHVTDLSTVATLTGISYTNDLDSVLYQKYLNSIWNTGVLPSYGENGCPVYFKPSSHDFGCILNGNHTNAIVQSIDAISPILRKKCGAFSFSLRDLTLFRVTPFIAKRAFFKVLFASARGHGHVDETETIYPMLIKAVQDDRRTSLIFVHTHGAHVPHDVTKDGRRTSGNGFNEGYDHYLDHAYFVLKQTAELFDEWRKNGIYNSSFIVLMSDHGSHCLCDTQNPNFDADAMPPQARPMLCVKPIGATCTLSYDDKTPTYSMHISTMLEKLRDNDLSISEITEMLTSTNRVFVMPEENRVRIWRVDDAGHGTLMK